MLPYFRCVSTCVRDLDLGTVCSIESLLDQEGEIVVVWISSPITDSVLRVMNQDPPSSDGGIRGGPGGVNEICGFKILDVQDLPIGGDGTHLGPGTWFSRPGECNFLSNSNSVFSTLYLMYIRL